MNLWLIMKQLKGGGDITDQCEYTIHSLIQQYSLLGEEQNGLSVHTIQLQISYKPEKEVLA